MGLSRVISSAQSGLHVTERGLDVVSRNIANAETPGYTRKTLRPQQTVAGEATSVESGPVHRELDKLLQDEMRLANAGQSYAKVTAHFLDQLDVMLGAPGSVNGLDTLYNDFTSTLSELIANPESTIVRQQLLARAEHLTTQLHQLSDGVQRLRTQAEAAIASDVRDANEALKNLQEINSEIVQRSVGGDAPADLLDARDMQIDRLSKIFDIKVTEHANHRVSVATSVGITLLEVGRAEFSFDAHSSLRPHSLYSGDPQTSGVGNLNIDTLSGVRYDMLHQGVIQSGSISAYGALRDDILVETQAQLDEIAANLALAMSTVSPPSSEITSGAQAGLSIDLDGMQPGDRVTLDYTESGQSKRVTFVRVDNPEQLPLDDAATSDPLDTVVGIDFSAGFSGAIGAINSALGANVTAQLSGTSMLEILDDGAAGLSDITAVTARITASALTGQGVGLPFFTDSATTTPIFSENLDKGSQTLGFAARISVNQALKNDPSRLIIYSTSPQTLPGDSARPQALHDRLTEQLNIFSPNSGIGSKTVPFEGTVGSFIQRVMDAQANQVTSAKQYQESQDLIAGTLNDRFVQKTGVNMDQEMARLLVLQNSFAANARVLSAASEMLDLLLQI